MTSPAEVTVTAVDYWADKPEQLAQLLATSPAPAIPDPSGRPVMPDQIAVFTLPAIWAQYPRELRDALAFGAGEAGPPAPASRTAAGAVGAVENRLVFTVEEAAQLLGISRSFAYEAVQRGEIPSMRIGRRILVPKVALERLLASEVNQASSGTHRSPQDSD
jgi:excisionase family DNA binding protein